MEDWVMYLVMRTVTASLRHGHWSRSKESRAGARKVVERSKCGVVAAAVTSRLSEAGPAYIWQLL